MIELHKHEDNTHRRKSLTNIKLEVTPKCSLYKKGCVTEAPPTHTHSTHPVKKGLQWREQKLNSVQSQSLKWKHKYCVLCQGVEIKFLVVEKDNPILMGQESTLSWWVPQ